jgi:hypothetical protein
MLTSFAKGSTRCLFLYHFFVPPFSRKEAGHLCIALLPNFDTASLDFKYMIGRNN